MHWAHVQPNYTLTRSHTFSRLQLVLLWVSGLVLAALFGFAAVATTAYELQIDYTLNLNGTENSVKWFERAPFSWLGSTQTACQEALLEVGAQYITKNQGFAYTIDRVSVLDPQTGLVNVTSQLAYRDQTLQSCQVSEIVINLARSANVRLAKNYWTWGATSAYATSICQIITSLGLYNVTLRVDLPGSGGSDIVTTFRTQNGTERQSMWYGIQIMTEWFAQIPRAMAWSVPFDADDAWADGRINIRRNASITDYRDIDLFIADYGQPTQNGGYTWLAHPGTFSTWASVDNGGVPNTSITINAFAKSFYSLLLTDFGVSDSTNALAAKGGPQYLQDIVDTVAQKASDGCGDGNVCGAGTVGQVVSNDTTIEPTLATQLASQYLCSVPKLRARISIIYSVVLAEIVFLRACWGLFDTVVTWRLGRRQPSANYCRGCLPQISDRSK